MNNQQSFMAGLLAGAGIMYILDPERGGRRRALIRDQIAHAGNELDEAREAARGRAQDARNRARGLVHETRSRLREEHVDDDVLVERVRAGMGRAVSNPGAIDVAAQDGRVTLRGPVLEDEADELVERVASVRGVVEVKDRLEARPRAGDVPGLQGTGE